MTRDEFLTQYTQAFPEEDPAPGDAGELLAVLAEDRYAGRAENEAQDWLDQIYFHPERAWSAAVEKLMEFYHGELHRRDEMIARQDQDWRGEVERVARDYQAEIARIFGERDRLLADQDALWRQEVERIARDYRAEILRICRERDKLLADQDLTWRLKQERAGLWQRLLSRRERELTRYRELPPLEAESLVSIVIVNFNGLHFLKTLLPGLLRQTYRPFEVIVVDNASSDGSGPFLKAHYPGIRLIESDKNLGFAGGNNLGIRAAQGSVLALLNNDTVVEPDWLFHLVDEMRFDSRIAAVGSKITFFKPYITLTLRAPTFCPAARENSPDTRALSLLLDEDSSVVQCSYRKPVFGNGFYGSERIAGRAARWASDSAEMYLPCDTLEQDLTVRLVAAGGRWNAGQPFTVELGGQQVGQAVLGEDFTPYEFVVPAAQWSGRTGYLINNAGSFLDESGKAGDRGIYQPDRGQYDHAEDVTALCGCSMLLRRAALEQVGCFDHDFFMYFEDTDLSWRLRRHGYRLRYQPASVVRHIHAGSSREWSPTFVFHTARNRVLMAIKNAPWPAAALSYGREWHYFLARLAALARTLVRGGDRSRLLLEARIRAAIHASLVRQIPKALLKRWGLVRDQLPE